MLTLMDRWLSRLEEWTVGLMLGTAALIIVVDVAARAVLNDSFAWSAEIVRYEIIWTVFIGASIAVRHGIHISIDALKEFLPPRATRPLTLLVLAVTVLFCLLLLWYGWQLVLHMRGFRQVSPAMQIPMWWVYLAIPVGAGLMLLRLLQAFATEVRGSGPTEPPPSTRQLAG